jgi:uncharacterized SAM-binding protein YcdF (DUF218 family)
MAKSRFKNIHFLRLLRILLILCGAILLASIVIAFTPLPFWGYYWLGTSKSGLKSKPGAIVLLGGGGMPSESNLMRGWFASKAAGSFPESKVYIVMPGDLADSLSTPVKMKDELVLRGVDPEKIRFENKGTNTRSQALNCGKLIPLKSPVLLITSPEYMRRAVLCFQKAGFEKVDALPAFENASEADFSFNDEELGGNKILVPNVGKNTAVRYQVWNHLKYEIVIVRESLALGYYKIRGWI